LTALWDNNYLSIKPFRCGKLFLLRAVKEPDVP
jgi:hypothetical protein